MKPKQSEDVRVLNDGLHSKRTQSAISELFTTHDLKDAIVYQFIASGSQDREEYQATMKAIMRHIRTKCRAEYIGAYEVGEEKNGLHIHAFVIIETVKHFPSDLLSVAAGGFLARLVKRKNKGRDATDKKLCIRIEPPKNAMHGGAMFARMDTPAKLENCINWAGYILKVRSKEDVPGRETYFGSEFTSNIAKREAKRQKYRDALHKTLDASPSADSPAPVQPTGAEMTSAEKYIASRYECAVDSGMDVAQIRAYLLAQGIKRTQAQVRHELDNVYGFFRYAESHPAPPKEDVSGFDRLVDSMPFARLAELDPVQRPAAKHSRWELSDKVTQHSGAC